jgi:hypothetical protein
MELRHTRRRTLNELERNMPGHSSCCKPRETQVSAVDDGGISSDEVIQAFVPGMLQMRASRRTGDSDSSSVSRLYGVISLKCRGLSEYEKVTILVGSDFATGETRNKCLARVICEWGQ